MTRLILALAIAAALTVSACTTPIGWQNHHWPSASGGDGNDSSSGEGDAGGASDGAGDSL